MPKLELHFGWIGGNAIGGGSVCTCSRADLSSSLSVVGAVHMQSCQSARGAVNSSSPLVDGAPISSIQWHPVAVLLPTSFFANSASLLVDGAPGSSNLAVLVSVLATDVIEKSQGIKSSSAPMAVLPSDFPAAVPALAIDRCFFRMGS